MKIVFTNVIYLPHIGGTEIIIHELAQYMINNLGWDVTVIVADKECKSVKREVIDNEKILRIPSFEIAHFPFLCRKKDLELVKTELIDADVVHVNSCKFLYRFFAEQKKNYHYRLIVTSHGWLYHTKNNTFVKDLYFKKIVAKYSSYYDGIINVSYQDQNIAREKGIKDSVVILNGVDIHKFSQLKPRDKFEGKFMYWGRIADNKGIYECIKKLSEYEENFVFNIIGKCEDEKYMEKLKDIINKKHLEEKVHFLGRLSDDDILKILEETDIILMPSLHEGFGMTLVECLLSHRPIIANTNESFTYILQQTGLEQFLFDFEDDKSNINVKIKELSTGTFFPRDVEQFSVEEMAKKTITLYKQG